MGPGRNWSEWIFRGRMTSGWPGEYALERFLCILFQATHQDQGVMTLNKHTLCPNEWIRRVAVISAKKHKRQRRKRQSVTAKREKSQTQKFV